MRSKTLIGVIFGGVIGCAIGVLGTRTYFKTKYEKIADEEIASVKESERVRFAKKLKDLENHPVRVDDGIEIESPERKVVLERQRKIDYTTYYKSSNDIPDVVLDPGGPTDDDPDDTDDVRNFELREKLSKNRGIEVIDENTFGEFPHFECRDLLYYEDGIITDEDEEIVANPGALIDMDMVSDWADSDSSDILYIRNHAISCDYAISRQGFVYGGDDE